MAKLAGLPRGLCTKIVSLTAGEPARKHRDKGSVLQDKVMIELSGRNPETFKFVQTSPTQARLTGDRAGEHFEIVLMKVEIQERYFYFQKPSEK